MALLTFLSDPSSSSDPKPAAATKKHTSNHKKRNKHPRQPPKHHQQRQGQGQPPPAPASSWDQLKNLLSCKHLEPAAKVHNLSRAEGSNAYSMLGSSCSSICNFKDIIHGNTRVVHWFDNSPEGSTVGQDVGLLKKKGGHRGSSSGRSSSSLTAARSATHSGGGGGSKGMQFRKLSGCYECRMIVDPSRYPYTPRSTICACSQCGEVFPKIESLELHQAVRHAVSELGPDDSGRNIVEIIFKSSWMKKDNPICKIERILKVHNTQRTIQRFEECRDAVKTRALTGPRRNPRCAADGNELLRFHCTSLTCSLGSRGSSSLCGSVPGCGVCTIIRQGFPGKSGQGQGHGESSHPKGVRTTASSGRAHDLLRYPDGRRAMLVCRVIAGKIKRAADDAPITEDGVMSSPAIGAMSSYYDSVAGCVGTEEMTVCRGLETRKCESRTEQLWGYCVSCKYCQCHVVCAKLKDSPAASAAYAALSTASTYVLRTVIRQAEAANKAPRAEEMPGNGCNVPVASSPQGAPPIARSPPPQESLPNEPSGTAPSPEEFPPHQ